ncbi:MAG: tagaturonate epimerase family protein [Infirmifilum sp.]
MLDTPRYLGKLPHLSVGVRLPEVFLEGIMSGFKTGNSAGGVMLSYHRETAPEYVINAPPGDFELTRGHTGTSIRHYIEASVAKAKEKGVVVEVEADHVSVSVSSEAVKRISGGGTHRVLSEEEVRSALKYIEDEIREAVSTRNIYFYTIDTCDLIDYSSEKIAVDELRTVFKDLYPTSLIERYKDINVVVNGTRIRFDEEKVMRLSLKLMRSIDVSERIYRIIKEMTPWPFGIEIAFDETPVTTDPHELFFVLNELRTRGIPVDFIAPNVGFQKREDFTGDLETLHSRVKTLHEVASFFGSLLSFHSGSGSSPYSMKGKGVHDIIRRAAGGLFKYKISGVYFELLMQLMSRSDIPSVRRLYEEIYDAVIELLEDQVKRKGELYDEVLVKRLEEHRKKSLNGYVRDSESPVFRYYSFLALNIRRNGERYLRNAIVELYLEDKGFREQVDREISALTVAFLDSLGFRGNVRLLR